MSTTPRLWKSLSQVNITDAPDPMSGGIAFQLDAQVARLADGGYVVVWTDMSRAYNPDGQAVVGQWYDAAGNKSRGEVNISGFDEGDQFSPAVAALPNGNVAVAFVDTSLGEDIYVRIFNSALGSVRTDFIDLTLSPAFDPSITALADGSYVVSYTVGGGSDTDIVARIVSPTGTVGAQFDVDNQTDNRNFSEIATLTNGNFVVVDQDEHGGSATNTDIDFAIFTPAGTPVIGPTLLSGSPVEPESDPDLAALRDGGFVVVWTRLYPPSLGGNTHIQYSVLSNDGTFIKQNILVDRGGGGDRDEASVVALADGGFLVTWEDDGANLVHAQRFDAAGNPVGTEFTVKNGVSPVDSPEAALLADGRIAYALGDLSTGDPDVMTSIFSTAAPTDFNPNGISDILWQAGNGTPALWLMDGTTAVSTGAIGSFNPGPGWRVKDSGDFNGDGRADVLWQGTDGTPAIWLMDGTNVVSASAAGSFNPGPSWQVKASGDFNGDSRADILWQGSDGTPAIWLMNGSNVLSNSTAGSFNPGPGWQIKATGDFNGDNKSDILWQGTDGTPAIWLMDGSNVLSNSAAGSFNPGPSWQIKATGDFNGDNKSDILWQNTDGTPAIWLMDGSNVLSNSAAGSFNPGPGWQIKDTGDYNGDNKSDILWQGSDGTPAIWMMDGSNVLSNSAAGSFNPGPDWHVIA
jgi:hypothetical protein